MEKQVCEFKFTLDLFSNQCKQTIADRITTEGAARIYIQASCTDKYFKLAGGELMSRESLGPLLVVLDLTICFLFVLSLSLLRMFEKTESRELTQHSLAVEDFAVKVKDLPDGLDATDMKPRLWAHMERVAGGQEVVNIQFGMTDYGKLKILIGVYRDMKEVFKEEMKLEKMN